MVIVSLFWVRLIRKWLSYAPFFADKNIVIFENLRDPK